jgi:pimeloyl-ACP methyl ester carboxylesterase
MLGASDSGRRVAFDVGGGTMAGIALGPSGRPPEVLFLHATGLNALTYRSLLEPMGEKYHVVAVDMRGHGRSRMATPMIGYVSWRRHRDDIIELISRHFPAAVTLAGHSMGATVCALVAGARADLARGICMIDPVVLPAGMIAKFQVPGVPLLVTAASPLSRGALRRRARFASKADAFAALKGRGFFRTWPDDVLADYVEDGFIETEKGVRLACSRLFEARTFAAHRHDTWKALARAPEPIVVLGAERKSTIGPGALRRLERLRPDAKVAVVEGATHALPMERPDRARGAIESAILLAGGHDRFADVD